MKKIVILLSAIVIALAIFTVQWFIERNKVISEQTATIQDVSSSYSQVVDSVGGLSWVFLMQQLDEIRSRLWDVNDKIKYQEELENKAKEERKKLIDQYWVLLQSADIVKQKAKEWMGLN